MKKFDKHKFVNIKAVNTDGNKLYKVTIRNRDTMEQERIAIDQLEKYISEKIEL